MMKKEEHYLKNRFLELANTAYEKNIYTYTDFLNINEINILNTNRAMLPPVKVELSGGNCYAERKIAVFSPLEVYYTFESPIVMLEIAPINSRYAESLSHRDFLGAILNLGIVRGKIGDIVLQNNFAYVYCIKEIASYIVDNLKKIKHTFVSVQISSKDCTQIAPTFKVIKNTVASVRLDSLIATAFGSSRSSIISYIEGEKVFVNGKLITSNGYVVKENDIVSVRGKGRFIFDRVIGTTKKGRNLIEIRVYI